MGAAKGGGFNNTKKPDRIQSLGIPMARKRLAALSTPFTRSSHSFVTERQISTSPKKVAGVTSFNPGPARPRRMPDFTARFPLPPTQTALQHPRSACARQSDPLSFGSKALICGALTVFFTILPALRLR